MADASEGVVLNPTFQAAGTPRALGISELGGLFGAQLDPEFYNFARRGWIFGATHTIATAVVPLQVVPTTVSF